MTLKKETRGRKPKANSPVNISIQDEFIKFIVAIGNGGSKSDGAQKLWDKIKNLKTVQAMRSK